MPYKICKHILKSIDFTASVYELFDNHPYLMRIENKMYLHNCMALRHVNDYIYLSFELIGFFSKIRELLEYVINLQKVFSSSTHS